MPRYANWQSDPARAPTRSVGRRMFAGSSPALGTDANNSGSVGKWQNAVTSLIHNFVRIQYTLDCPFGVHGKRPLGLAGSSPVPSADSTDHHGRVL